MDGEDPNSLLLPEIHVDLPPTSSTSNSLDWDDLRARSLRPGGFGKERATIWPQLLCVSPQPSTETETEEEHELEPHPDERQIKLDTDRSFVLYPVDESMTDRVQRQQELNALLTSIFRRHPGLSYFQGYHDIITVLLLTLPPPLRLPAAEKLSLHRLRDSMGKTLEPLIGLLRILQRLLRLADPAYASLLEQSSPLPYPLLSPLLTLFSHDIPTLPHIQHIFDYLLCRPPLAVVYLAAAVVMEGESGRRGRVEGVFGVGRTCRRARSREGQGAGGERTCRRASSAGGDGDGDRNGDGDGDGDGEEEEEEERDVGMVFSLLAGVPEMWDGEDEDEDIDFDADENEEGGDAEGEDAVEKGKDEPEEIISLDSESVTDDQHHSPEHEHEHDQNSQNSRSSSPLIPTQIPHPDDTLLNDDTTAFSDESHPHPQSDTDGETEGEGEITLVGTSPSPFVDTEDLADEMKVKVKPVPPPSLGVDPVVTDVRAVGIEGGNKAESAGPPGLGKVVEVEVEVDAEEVEGETTAGSSGVVEVEVEVEDPDRKEEEVGEEEEEEEERGVDPADIPLPHSRAPSSSRSRSRPPPPVTVTKSAPRSRSSSSKSTPNPTSTPNPKPKPNTTPKRKPQSKKKPRPPLTLTSLLTQSDALMAQYPPSHPALHLHETMGPKSVVRTWAEHDFSLGTTSASSSSGGGNGGQAVMSDGHVLSDAECEEIVRSGKIEDVVLPWDPSMDEPEQPSSGRDGDSDSESEGEGEEHERSWFGLGALVRRPHLRHRHGHGRRPSTSHPDEKGEKSESEKAGPKEKKGKPKRPRRKLRKQHRPFFGAPRGVEFDRRTMIAGAALVLGVAMAVYASRGGGGGGGGGYGRGRMGGVGGLVGVLGEMFGGEVGGGRGFGM
ncbi:uncharacterized protein STEHIDRAFT_166906 [Stereum hirsutum FP-91666 SS1]|uniref:uncharacterized protein n=1 Tax=Stereum hirsutum (strain FP-91666) TaxID=721885 RepID=UPI000440F614|nr:uncharacterized protein STEHIDRAFT_166906 [Stereum hirsutum FP-91666 SS1]EIM88956.1 hypothetical protein STEHIDRAFT_166906 [Stereum hirsutum FP-91666 SS1]